MARADVDILLSVDEWGAIMGIDPYELNQVTLGFPNNSTNTQNAQCAHAFFQYSWQQDFLSRQEVGEAIQKAEQALAEFMLFWPAPKAIYAEVVQFPQPHERYLFGAGTTKRFQKKPIQLDWSKVQTGGQYVATDLGAQAIVYSDANSDGILDTFTVTFATTITDPNQLALYFTPADRDNATFDATWRIRPVKVSVSGGNATIKGGRWLCIKPDLQSAYGAQNLDVTVAGNFVTTLQAYSLVVDTSTANSAQGVAVWENFPDNDCAGSGTPCVSEVWPICLDLKNPDMGLVTADYWLNGGNTPSSPREPDRLTINYIAGYPRQADGRMDRTMADMVAHLATAWLPVDKCGCERSSRIVHWWRSFPSDGVDTRSITQKEVDDNPFGPTMGALYAWQRAKVFSNIFAVGT